MNTSESRLEALRQKMRLAGERSDDVVVKFRSYADAMVRPHLLDRITETFARCFRQGMRGAELWCAVISTHPDATNWELTAAGGRTARRVFSDGRMKQSYHYAEYSTPRGAA